MSEPIRILHSSIGQEIFIDNDLYPILSKYTWRSISKGNTYYAIKQIGSKKRKTLYMHRYIMGLQLIDGTEIHPEILIDHINQCGLDNRKINLRISTKSTNAMNSKKRKNCSSKYKGVSWNKIHKKWEVYINLNKRRIRLGYYLNEQEAAIAYNNAAKEFHKEFACLNQL